MLPLQCQHPAQPSCAKAGLPAQQGPTLQCTLNRARARPVSTHFTWDAEGHVQRAALCQVPAPPARQVYTAAAGRRCAWGGAQANRTSSSLIEAAEQVLATCKGARLGGHGSAARAKEAGQRGQGRGRKARGSAAQKQCRGSTAQKAREGLGPPSLRSSRRDSTPPWESTSATRGLSCASKTPTRESRLRGQRGTALPHPLAAGPQRCQQAQRSPPLGLVGYRQ